MSGDQGMNMLYLVLCMVLVGSALIGMRLPIGKALKMLLAWVAIFGVAFALFTFRSEFSAFGARLKAEATGTPIEAGEALRIAMRDELCAPGAAPKAPDSREPRRHDFGGVLCQINRTRA